MAGKNVGSINAKVTLDVSEFNDAISTLKEDIATIKDSFKQANTGKGLVEDVENLKKEMESLREKTNDYKKTISDLRKQLKNTGFKNTVKEINTLNSALNELSGIKITPKGLVDFQNNWHRVSLEVKKSSKEIQGAIEKFAQTNEISGKYIAAHSLNIGKRISEINGLKTALTELSNTKIRPKGLEEFLIQWDKVVLKVKRSVKEIQGAMEKYAPTYPMPSEIVMESTLLNEIADSATRVSNRIKLLRNDMNLLTVDGSKNATELNTIAAKLKESSTEYNHGRITVLEYRQSIAELSAQLTQLSAKMTSQTKYNAQSKKSYAEVNAELKQAAMNYNATGKATQSYTQQLQRNNAALSTGQKSMRKFGTSMGKAEAHSNNLYRGLQKVRSVIISMKTIAGAIGAMAVWNFAFELLDKAKETYSAKNEMESLLEKNSRVSAAGQQTFNKALDDTIKRFQRINKYSIGETTASIGLEFELNAKEMSKALEVVAMIQNEYIRAGRTTEEASLAVKDILQGEFTRLSRETGVGKEELQNYGWNGDNKDVQSLMKALQKAAKDRHWDLFASKATSVNDVIQITQNRFAEFGASLITEAEPLIVESFNGMISVIDNLKSGFDSMDSFGKVFSIVATSGGAFVGISTALMMLKRNMGLAQIATIGWGRSLFTALLRLNKTEVALHGFWKTLTATISGTKTTTVATMGLKKAIAANVLGVNQDVAAQKGLLTALVANKMAMVDTGKGLETLEKAQLRNSVASAKWYQKIGFLNGGLKANEVQTAGLRKSLLNLSVAAKAAKIALLGITLGAVVTYFATVAQWADAVKKRVETYQDILSNGNSEIKEATDTLEDYEAKLSKLSKNNPNYGLTESNRDTANANVNDLKLSLKLAKQIKKSNKEITESHKLTSKGLLNIIYSQNGVKNVEKFGQKYQQIKQVAYDIQKSEDERYQFEYHSLQHINEHVKAMKQAGVTEQDRVKYITEYSAKAEEAAEHLKKFNQGDVNEGAYYVYARLQLLWIDLWNDDHFVNFWKGVNKTWKEVLPTLKTFYTYLIELGHGLMDFFSTDIGRWTGNIVLFGGAIGAVIGKLSKWTTGNNVVLSGLKKLGSSLVERIKNWRNMGKAAEEANIKSGGTDATSTTVEQTTKQWKKGEFWKTAGNDAKNIARNYLKAATHMALAMGLVVEAIALLNVAMYGIAKTGDNFKSIEPQVRKGIEGLKLIAPTVITIITPIIAYMTVVNKYGTGLANTGMTTEFKMAAQMIVEGMILVTEAIIAMAAPMAAIAALGWVKGQLGDSVEKGKAAIEATSSALEALYPVIPVFIAAIALGAIGVFTDGIGFVAEAAVIGGGMLAVAGVIVSLSLPMQAIADLGNKAPNTSSIKKGSETIKQEAIALTYVEDAVGSLVGIGWDLLEDRLLSLASIDMKSTLDLIVADDGIFNDLSTFDEKFASFKFKGIDSRKATDISTAANSITKIGVNLKEVHSALKNLPDFDDATTYSGTALEGTGYAKMNETTTTESTNYFDKVKKPVKQLKEFIDKFNKDKDLAVAKVDSDRLTNINQAANMLSSIKSTIDNVKNAMSSMSSVNWEAGMAGSGVFGALQNFFVGGGGKGDYSSSIGSALYDMEMVIKDLANFSSSIANYSVNGSSNVEGLVNFVSSLSAQLSRLNKILASKASEIKNNAKLIGSNIISGIRSGLTGLDAVGQNIVNRIANSIMNSKQTLYNTSNSLGNTASKKFKEGITPMSRYMREELGYIGKAIDDKKTILGDKSYYLGTYMADRYQDGIDMHSAGRMARATGEEMDYLGGFLDNAITNLPQKTSDLASKLTENFKPSFTLSNLKLPNLNEFQQGLSIIPSTVDNVKNDVSVKFNEMSSNVSAPLASISDNAKVSYNNIVNTTKKSLGSMQSKTIKNIGAIKTSWKGMQDALIGSAENIRKKTGDKINNLRDNMASFWRRIRNPSLLLQGSAGSPTNSSRSGRVYRPHSMKRNVSSTLRYAGTPELDTRKAGTNSTLREKLAQLLQSILDGKQLYAGWNYNWNTPIQNNFKNWKTNFQKYSLDDYLNANNFYNNNFPVKGIKDIAKDYIYDVISRTNYDFYYNSKFGSNPLSIWNAGAFNCYDGTQLVLALARAFGFEGSPAHTTWNGIGHMFAKIKGLGVIDSTAIQQRGAFKARGVKYAGSPVKNNVGETHNYNGDVNIHIHTDGNNVKVDEKPISQRDGKRILDILGINPATGR